MASEKYKSFQNGQLMSNMQGFPMTKEVGCSTNMKIDKLGELVPANQFDVPVGKKVDKSEAVKLLEKLP